MLVIYIVFLNLSSSVCEMGIMLSTLKWYGTEDKNAKHVEHTRSKLDVWYNHF